MSMQTLFGFKYRKISYWVLRIKKCRICKQRQIIFHRHRDILNPYSKNPDGTQMTAADMKEAIKHEVNREMAKPIVCIACCKKLT